jgi:hypothetical protein
VFFSSKNTELTEELAVKDPIVGTEIEKQDGISFLPKLSH